MCIKLVDIDMLSLQNGNYSSLCVFWLFIQIYSGIGNFSAKMLKYWSTLYTGRLCDLSKNRDFAGDNTPFQ